MKTKFNIAWVDDNFSDVQMESARDLLTRQLKRKNGFSISTNDVFAEAVLGDLDTIIAGLAKEIDRSNSVDLVMVDYELGDGTGENLKGEVIAKKFRDQLPFVDIIFYSGKKAVGELRTILAQENVDCVNCVGRGALSEDSFSIIQNIIDRSYKISTLRGLILNSVCEMDNMIIEIICKYSAVNNQQRKDITQKAVILIERSNKKKQQLLSNEPVEDLLRHKNMMSGKLFSILDDIKGPLKLSSGQKAKLSSYREDILVLRTSAAHAKEGVCNVSGQSMLEFKGKKYKRCDIDDICKIIVEHESNIASIMAVI
ncbi:MAG: hypothetical protein V7776_02150 [Halopseudomonas aestusnigri]